MIIILKIQLVCQLLEIIGFLSKSQRGNMKNWSHTWVEVGFNKNKYMRYPQFGGNGCSQLRWQLLFCMKTWQIIQFEGGATMLAAFSFTFIILMHIVLHIKCQIWIEHISQTTNFILMKFGHGMHNIMKNIRDKFHLNLVHVFQENDHHHLQLVRIFLEIRDVSLSNFWRRDEI